MWSGRPCKAIRRGVGRWIRLLEQPSRIRQHPSERATIDQVHVDVKNFLAGVGPTVQDEPVSRLVDTSFLSEPGSHPDHAAECRLVRIGHVGDGRNRLVGGYDDVGRRLGLDVVKRRHQLVLVNDIRGNLPADDLREDRVCHQHRTALGRLGIAMQPLPATPMRIGMANVGAMKSAAPLGSDLGVRCRGLAMKIITAYLIRAHMGPFLFAFTALTGLLFLNAFAVRMADLVGKGLAWSVIGEFVLLSLPHTVALTLPMAILVSVLYTFSELTGANEITAMAAGGIRPLRMLLPLLVIGTIFAGLMLFFNDQVLPDSNHRLKSLIIDVAQKSPTFELRERVVNEIDTEDRNGAVYLQAATIDAVTNEMTEVVIYDLTDPNAHRTIYAERGTMAFSESGTDLYLTLYDGFANEAGQEGGGEFNRSEFERQIVPLRGVGDELERREGGASRSDREMSIAMLRAEILNRTEEIVEVRQRSLTLAQKTIAGALASPDPDLIEAGHTDEADEAEAALGGRGSILDRGRGQRLSLRTDDLTQQAALGGRGNLGRVLALQQSADQFLVEIYKKYSIAFACIVFVLLGAPLAIRFPRGGVGMVIVTSVVIFAVYWAGLIGGENLANKGLVTPFWAMWTVDLVFLGFGIVLAARMSRTAGSNRGGALDEALFKLSSSGRRMSTRSLVG